MDGARLWNAAAATGLPLSRITAGVDSVSVCYSKGEFGRVYRGASLDNPSQCISLKSAPFLFQCKATGPGRGAMSVLSLER